MEWILGRKLKSVELIDEFERLIGYSFCDSFKEAVMLHNAAYTDPDTFDTVETKGRVFRALFSFNKEDRGSIWKMCGWDDDDTGMEDRYVEFADSPFGDSIAFDRQDDSVVFIDHETLHVEKIADDFDGFLNCLYVDTDDDESD